MENANRATYHTKCFVEYEILLWNLLDSIKHASFVDYFIVHNEFQWVDFSMFLKHLLGHPARHKIQFATIKSHKTWKWWWHENGVENPSPITSFQSIWLHGKKIPILNKFLPEWQETVKICVLNRCLPFHSMVWNFIFHINRNGKWNLSNISYEWFAFIVCQAKSK